MFSVVWQWKARARIELQSEYQLPKVRVSLWAKCDTMNLNGTLDAQGPFRQEGVESEDEVATTQRAKGGRQERLLSCAGGVGK